MKKNIFIVIGIIVGVLVLSIGAIYLFLTNYEHKGVIRGYKGKKEFYGEGIQDHVDYCKYLYDNEFDKKFRNNKLYKKVTKIDINNIKGYFDNFEGWMEAEDRMNEYDFSKDSISVGDYIYIDTKEGEPIGKSTYEKYDDYSICFYDIEKHMLYYIHSNI